MFRPHFGAVRRAHGNTDHGNGGHEPPGEPCLVHFNSSALRNVSDVPAMPAKRVPTIPRHHGLGTSTGVRPNGNGSSPAAPRPWLVTPATDAAGEMDGASTSGETAPASADAGGVALEWPARPGRATAFGAGPTVAKKTQGVRLACAGKQIGEGSRRLAYAPPQEHRGAAKDAHMLAAFRQKLGQRAGVAIHEVSKHQIVGRRANRELQADDDAVAIALGAGPHDIERLRSGIAAHTVDGQPAPGRRGARRALHKPCGSDPDRTPANRYVLDRHVGCIEVKTDLTAPLHDEAGIAAKLPPLRNHAKRRSGDDEIEQRP